jgi:3',5'-cyclic-nucleotide phosphodiesterase/cAMP-specific phosphodiesterase 4
MHGADVCQSICLYFLNSNAEKIFQTTVLDLLSILISSLGHDLGHPGLNNNFHINARTELALTYNDASCLENFHCSKLFNILKKDETNIFEVLSANEFKDIRKRMISEILATDMFFHKKIISTTQAIVPRIKPDKFEFISQDKESIKAEQQTLLDYLIHSADLGHNSKLFRISIKWVELLSEEFWLQGDKEKFLGISVSFLCDRADTNVPKGQVNFLKGFILPTFDLMASMFPGLHFTVDNVLINIKEWQKLADENRQRGWTPKKINKEDEKDLIKSNNKTYKLGGGFGNKLPIDFKDSVLRKNSQ